MFDLRLKSLELQGFKSFPDHTLLNFDKGVTVVVGPNGSGKSNISDAIRWVLGEISSKNIRGNKMEDVVFGGTDSRRAMNFSEVSLTIDNTDDGFSDSRIDMDYDEITVTRRFYRSGDSEYMINRKPVRLKDINEMFMNTGIGRSGYSIIGQGKIAEIISQKSDERRNIFEEAAGISKYRYKKAEAEHKLDEVADNITRLNDIISEIEARLSSLEADAEKARRYLEVYEAKKRSDVSLWLYDIDSVKVQLADINDSYTIAKNELDITDSNLKSTETQSDKLFQIIQDNKLKSEQFNRKIRESSELKYEAESSVKISANDISHLSSQIEQTETDLNLKREALDSAKSKNNALVSAYKNLKTTYSNTEKDYASNQTQADEINSELLCLIDTISVLESESKQLNLKLTELRIKYSSLESSRQGDLQRKKDLTDELDEKNKSCLIYEQRIGLSSKSINECSDKKQALNKEIEKLESEYSYLTDENNKLRDNINNLQLDISSKRQRIENLHRMEELFEGYAQSVKSVMNSAEKNEIQGIYGPISRIINVNPRYSVAIETSLGANIQNIVVEDENAAKSAINMLKKNNAGRATFYPLSSVSPQSVNIDISDLKKYKGYIGIASDLVEYESKFNNIIKYMLGRTVVFDNIENASVMAKAFGYRVRVVTLDGQLINAGGSFTGGSIKRDSGMLTRAFEVEKYEKDIIKLRLEIKTLEAKSDNISLNLSDSTQTQSDLKKKLKMLETFYQAENTQLQVLRTQLNADKDHISLINANLTTINKHLESYDADNVVLTLRIEEAQNGSEYSEAHHSEIEVEINKLKSELESLNAMGNALMIKLTAQGKDIEASEKLLESGSQTIDSLNEQITRDEGIIFTCNEKIIQIENDIELNKLKSITLTEDLQTYEKEQKLCFENITRLEKQSEEIRSRFRELTRKREVVFSEYTKLESKRNQIVSEQDKLINKLWEEYELTYSTASELDYPKINESGRIGVVSKQNELRLKLKEIGSVNISAIEEFKEVKTRYDFLTLQLNDLKNSGDRLTSIIYKLEQEMRVKFTNAMEDINSNFKNVFRELFGGGSADLSFTDPSNVLESGIEINVAPPGKIIKSLSLLSGGEQAFVAIALFFAILKVNPTPFCILDEIEAALDEVNVQRFAEYSKIYSDKTQFIIITHRRGTMEVADTLYGVTMYEKGISKVLSLNVNEVEQKIGVKL